MNEAIIFDIQRNSFVDGPGVRTTVFFKGCNLRCLWCHNPESQSCAAQMLFYRDKCINCGKCKEVCKEESCTLCGKCTLYCPVDARKVCGKAYTADAVLYEVLQDEPYYDRSGGGVTFSGGECMLQIDFLAEILEKCSQNGIHTAVDTAGCVPFESFERILPFTDLFLYDVKIFDGHKHKRYTGADNTLILENLKKLCRAGANIIVRIPVIPGVNDTKKDMMQIKAFLSSCGRIEKVELLPYHVLGEHKYAALGRETAKFNVPCREAMDELKAVFAAGKGE